MLGRASVWLLDYAYAARVSLGASLRHRSVPRPRGDLAPVLLIPGVFERWQFLRAAGGRLARAGHPVHVVELLGRNIDEIPDAAALAQRYLDEHDLRHVTIVAHSKGGLIGKHMMLFDDVDGRIDKLVAIASPFQGSSLAKYLPVRPLRAFIPTATTLTLLAANAEVNSRIVSIFGDYDPHIPIGSRLEGATNIALPTNGHFRLLADERVLDQVVAAVASELPPTNTKSADTVAADTDIVAAKTDTAVAKTGAVVADTEVAPSTNVAE
jgi:alpha-beta hydrolase superfamily lysophospholipase